MVQEIGDALSLVKIYNGYIHYNKLDHVFVKMRPVWTLKMEIDLVLKLQRNCILLPLQAMTNPCRPSVASFKSPARSTAALQHSPWPRPRQLGPGLVFPDARCTGLNLTDGAGAEHAAPAYSVTEPGSPSARCTVRLHRLCTLYTVHTWRSAWLRARAVDK